MSEFGRVCERLMYVGTLLAIPIVCLGMFAFGFWGGMEKHFTTAFTLAGVTCAVATLLIGNCVRKWRRWALQAMNTPEQESPLIARA